MGAALVAAACLSNDPLFAQKKAAPTPAKTAPTPAPAKTRTEKDLLGEKQVPAEAYYGVQTMRGMESFQLSGVAINHYPGYVEAWAIVKLAAARANIEVGAMTPERLAMIEKAAAAVLAGKYHDQFLVDWPRSPSSSRSGSPPLPKG
jgi:aspartate ammonia-lyase